ncbi:hypothetical protein FRC08_003558 [Ceratobasidium sp. 394]|nr:hypothetical protein FRC08_003558 [Ceratobasidium sp. 394]
MLGASFIRSCVASAFQPRCQAFSPNLFSVATRSKSKLLSPAPRPEQAPLVCWVDATPGRAAILVGDAYRSYKIDDNQDNNFGEAVALELLARELASRNHVGKVTVHSDSEIALGAFKGQKYDSLPEVAESSARARSIVASSKFEFETVKVESKKNLADPLSRGKNPSGYRPIKGAAKIPKALKGRVHAE